MSGTHLAAVCWADPPDLHGLVIGACPHRHCPRVPPSLYSAARWCGVLDKLDLDRDVWTYNVQTLRCTFDTANVGKVALEVSSLLYGKHRCIFSSFHFRLKHLASIKIQEEKGKFLAIIGLCMTPWRKFTNMHNHKLWFYRWPMVIDHLHKGSSVRSIHEPKVKCFVKRLRGSLRLQ